MMELTRLSPSVEMEADEASTRTDDSIVSIKSRNTPTSSLIEESQRSLSKKDPKESPGTWSKLKHPGRAWDRWRSGFGWQTGVQVGFGISILAFTANLILLAVGAIRKPGYQAGIGMLHSGTSDEISRLSTAYHVIINILSTGLLTSSSYCMQLLCAPRREDIDAVHARGDHVDVGILSFRNLRFISRYRSILVLILAVTSVPLHLLYNSAIFEVTAGQDYAINFVNSRNTTLINDLSSNMTKLENTKWQSLYGTKYIPNSGDLYLVIDSISFNINVEIGKSNWELTPPDNKTDYIWQALPLPANPQNTSIPMTLSLMLNESSGTFVVAQQQPMQRVVVPLTGYSTSSMPIFDFPGPLTINVTNSTWNDVLALNPDSWMFPPFHIDYAFSESVPNSSSVQISLAFMLVVVICNALKVVVIYRTLKEPLSSQILTFGDAVSSFLEHPDPITVGFCTLGKGDIIENLKHPSSDDVKPWQYHRRFVESSSRERWASNIFIWSAAVISFIIMIVAILLARPNVTKHTKTDDVPWDWNWATSSIRQLPIAQSSFSTGGILFNAWLANVPQLVLSMAYFALNRICTSICFTREWNSCATLPLGCSPNHHIGSASLAPFTIAFSRSPGDSRHEWHNNRRRIQIDGGLFQPELVFATTYLVTLFVVLGLQLRRITLRIPPANHCSLAISAACHPPPEDANAQLKQVQWGVVRERFGARVGHCSFTSEDVLTPEQGKRYA